MNDDSRPPSTDEPSNGSTSWIRRIGKSLAGNPQDRNEIIEFLKQARNEGLIDEDAMWMMRGVLDVSELQVEDVMVPRSQMVVVERDASLDEILKVVVDSGHSRFPVIGESRDEVVGVLMAKELLRIIMEGSEGDRQTAAIRAALRSAVFVPETKRINVLLKEFRASRNHIAVVVDEYGGVSGLVTIEDVLEQIVGEIDDEYDEAEGASILRQDKSRYVVQGLTPITEFNQFFETSFSDEEFDTVAGLVTHAFGHMPRRGESIVLDRFQFNVYRADSRRVHQLQVTVRGGSSVRTEESQP